MLGNEGSGLNANQIAMCDHFVYIPQYTDKTASLNVAIAGSIIFHHWALFAQYPEAGREGQKYNTNYYKSGIETKRIIMQDGEVECDSVDHMKEQRAIKKAQVNAAVEGGLDFDCFAADEDEDAQEEQPTSAAAANLEAEGEEQQQSTETN